MSMLGSGGHRTPAMSATNLVVYGIEKGFDSEERHLVTLHFP
jgi:hypothetical protein